MADPTTNEAAAARVALGPKRVQVGNQSVEAQSIDEIEKAENFVKGKQASTSATRGMRFLKIKPGDCG